VLNISKVLIWLSIVGDAVKAARALEIIGVNIVLLLALYFVASDVATRTTYAAREGYSYFFSQSFLTEVSTLQGRGESLQSPLTLGWLQLILAVLVILDALYLYGWVQKRRALPTQAA
jgi:hypothetical protein